MMSGAGRIPFVSPAGLVSPTLTWETVVNPKYRARFYHPKTKGLMWHSTFSSAIPLDMLTDVTYPQLLGTPPPHANAADLRTSGWELAVTWRDRIGQDWRYSSTLHLADNQAEITKYDNPTGALNEWL
jgi:hypothetical protein